MPRMKFITPDDIHLDNVLDCAQLVDSQLSLYI